MAMARRPTETGGQPALGAAARKRAFLLAAATVLAAAGLMLALGDPRHDDGSAAERKPERRVFGPDRGALPPPPLERAPDAAELRDVRATAARFARAYLARESGRFAAAVRRQLQATASPGTWLKLRTPVRVPPASRPPLSSFERVAGLTETTRPSLVEATVAFHREGRQLYFSLLLSREGGQWRASLKGL